jgi:hypothetical protein
MRKSPVFQAAPWIARPDNLTGPARPGRFPAAGTLCYTPCESVRT